MADDTTLEFLLMLFPIEDVLSFLDARDAVRRIPSNECPQTLRSAS